MSQNINSFATPSVTLNKSIDSGTSNINSIDSNYMESESLQNAPDAVSLVPPSSNSKPMTFANSDENHASGN
uniref:Uncharacterized protein n=1 Tax=Fagus sylvatica TaxID=28930 RepID=A0A2N9IJQ0_FAGSY